MAVDPSATSPMGDPPPIASSRGGQDLTAWIALLFGVWIVGGLVLQAFGRLPKRGESTVIGDFRFRVVRADSRRLHTLQVERIAPAAPADAGG